MERRFPARRGEQGVFADDPRYCEGGRPGTTPICGRKPPYLPARRGEAGRNRRSAALPFRSRISQKYHTITHRPAQELWPDKKQSVGQRNNRAELLGRAKRAIPPQDVFVQSGTADWIPLGGFLYPAQNLLILFCDAREGQEMRSMAQDCASRQKMRVCLSQNPSKQERAPACGAANQQK